MSLVSDCCGAYTEYDEYGLCPECKDHCVFIEEDEDDEDDN